MNTARIRSRTTLLDLIEFLWPHESQRELIPWWPPDVFAVTASILRKTGGYVCALQLQASERRDCLGKEWCKEVRGIAAGWRASLNAFVENDPHAYENIFAPAAAIFAPIDVDRDTAEVEASVRKKFDIVIRKFLECVAGSENHWWTANVKAWWSGILDHGNLPLEALKHNGFNVTSLLLKLCCAADDACEGIGVRDVRKQDASDRFFRQLADLVLATSDGRTLCLAVPHDRATVLPKQHTPQRGLTLRSLSHHLSLHPSTEVSPRWVVPVSRVEREPLDVINLLLLPWPVDTRAEDFTLVRDQRVPRLPDSHRFFTYDPSRGVVPSFTQRLSHAFAEAKRHAERIHAIVFPELALSMQEFREAEEFALKHKTLLIAGHRATSAAQLPANAVSIQYAGFTTAAEKLLEDWQRAPDGNILDPYRITQFKHHRWCLDKSQILQYALGGRLPASKDCWELTDITSRDVNFLTIDSWLTWTVLICEDLARQDPVAEVIRSAGPNMVIALLMDGPQLRERWPSRYASVLAEDPGCSVLTLTSLGMSRRTRARETHRAADSSNAFALWRDIDYGPRELCLEEESHDSCVLSLVCKTQTEFTSDGRMDDQTAHSPVFAGIHTFSSIGP